MTILRKLYEFDLPTPKLLQIYTLFIRSILEQSSVVWSSSITEEESNSIERVQKVALRIIYREKYTDYTSALERAKLPSLVIRRQSLLYKFAIKCTKNPKTSYMLPKNI